MKRAPLNIILAVALLLPATWAHGAITCSVSSPGFSTGYDAAATISINQTSYTVSCNRASAADPTSVSYTVATNNGSFAVGQNNRAVYHVVNQLQYDTYKDSLCNTIWKANSPIAGTINFTTTGTVTAQTAFWGCIPAGQTGLLAATYTDTVTLTLSYGSPAVSVTGSYPVSITPPNNCQITTAPGNIAFTYTSFGSAVTATTSFATNCTNALPYTLALDATSATLIGLNYTLALSASTATGTGLAQTFSITGNIAAGQAGICTTATCTGSQLRTLTITY